MRTKETGQVMVTLVKQAVHTSTYKQKLHKYNALLGVVTRHASESSAPRPRASPTH